MTREKILACVSDLALNLVTYDRKERLLLLVSGVRQKG
jgi:hypothetical protein